MSGLAIIVLIGVVAHLWQRVNRLHERVEHLEAQTSSPPATPFVGIEDRAPAVAITADLREPSTVPLRIEPEFDPIGQSSIAPEEPDPAVVHPSNHDPVEEPKSRIGFEDIFGRRLPIWAGGITLAVAGMLIVKYSIDAGLISPLVRVISGLVFGFALIGGAEAALRADEKVRDPRVRQALSGAGIASLYGAILIASNLYGLISPVTAFLGMAAVTALAMGLSLRFGAPSALLGLAGGLAAPALVGSGEPNIPLLASYLTLAVGGLTVLSRSQRWMWLGVTALMGGFGWAGLLLISGTLDTIAAISLGLYIILLGIVLPLVAFSGSLGNIVRVAGSIAAAVQIAGLVATGGFTLLHWSLFGLISIAILWLAARDEALRRLPAVGLAIALVLLFVWPDPTPMRFGIVMVAAAILYGTPALLTLWRAKGSMLEAAEIAAIGLAGLIVPMFHFYRFDGSNDISLAVAALISALLPAGGAALVWRSGPLERDHRPVVLVSTSAALLAAASALALPAWTLAPVVGLVALALLMLCIRFKDPAIEVSALAFAGLSLALLTAGAHAPEEFERLRGSAGEVTLVIALVRWAGLAGIFALFAWKSPGPISRDATQGLAALLGYGALTQLPLGSALPLVPAVGVLAIGYTSRNVVPNRLLPAFCALLGVTILWAAAPLTVWSISGFASLFGFPLFVSSLPNVQDTLLRLLAAAVLIVAGWHLARTHLQQKALRVAFATALVLGATGLHILFKQLWSIDGMTEFVRVGLIERISWEALLLGGALLAWRFERPRVALAFTAAGLAHFGWYTLILHNPLIDEQAVGPTPIANLLLPAYGLPLAWLWLLKEKQASLPGIVERIRSAAPMLLIFLLAFSLLRQAFHGSILPIGSVTAGEDILRSITAILLAIGFLLWGIHRGSRDWRIASLAIMIAAVAKVFLLDAAELTGLLRIASFIALGLSLIGIGWLYSRFLNDDRKLDPSVA